MCGLRMMSSRRWESYVLISGVFLANLTLELRRGRQESLHFFQVSFFFFLLLLRLRLPTYFCFFFFFLLLLRFVCFFCLPLHVPLVLLPFHAGILLGLFS